MNWRASENVRSSAPHPVNTQAPVSGTGCLYRDAEAIFEHVEALTSPVARGIGLLGRKRLPDGAAVLLTNCKAIHTCFMMFVLDVAFLNEDMVVMQVRRRIRPFRMVFGPSQACAVLEWRSGWLAPEALAKGDRMVWRNKA